MKIAVIGGNHAGTAAINTILSCYPETQVTVFEQNSNMSFLGCGMALWIGHQISGSEGLFYSSKEQLQAKGATVYTNTYVTKVNYETKTIFAQTQDGKEFTETYDKLILATGSNPILPNIPGMELENVQQVKLFQDAQAVVEKLENPEIKTVTVVGAGYVGVELAEAFIRNGKKTRLIDCAKTCLTGYYDEDFCKKMEGNLQNHGVETYFEQTVTAVEGKNGKVDAIVTTKGTYQTDMVVFAIGFKPNTALGQKDLSLHTGAYLTDNQWCDRSKGAALTLYSGAYLVDRTQQTSEKDVYAIGDCAVVYNNAKGREDYIALATNAVRSGIIAAHNACGTKMESPGVQGSNGISIWGLNLVSTGLTKEKAKASGFDVLVTEFTDWQKASFMEDGNEKTTLRIVYDAHSRVILGAQMISRYDISMGIHLFSLAIQQKLTIDQLKLLDLFFLPHFNQPYNYITMAALQAE